MRTAGAGPPRPEAGQHPGRRRRAMPRVADFGLAVNETLRRPPRRRESPARRPTWPPSRSAARPTASTGGPTSGRSGVILYQALTGRPPFPGESRRDLRGQILNAEPRPRPADRRRDPRRAGADLPEVPDAKRMTDRYDTAADLAEDLRHWLDHEADAASRAPGPAADGPEPSVAVIRQGPAGLRAQETPTSSSRCCPARGTATACPRSSGSGSRGSRRPTRSRRSASACIYGPSGGGKSSLVKAGLLPRLAPRVQPVFIEATRERDRDRDCSGPCAAGVARSPRDARAWPRAWPPSATGPGRAGSQGPPDPRPVRAVAARPPRRHDDIRLGPGTPPVRRPPRPVHHPGARRFLDGGHAVHEGPGSPGARGRELGGRRAVRPGPCPQGARSVRPRLRPPSRPTRGAVPDPGPIPRPGDRRPEAARRADRPRPAEPVRRDGPGPALDPRHAQGRRRRRGDRGRVPRGDLRRVERTARAPIPPGGRASRCSGRSCRGQAPTSRAGCARSARSGKPRATTNGRPTSPSCSAILDTELRLVTPTDREGKKPNEAGAASEPPGETCYQLTHDDLVPSIRDWLTRKQRETRRGRAEIRLAERATLWQSRPETRLLPSFLEWSGIRWLTRPEDWTESERRMMKASARRHLRNARRGRRGRGGAGGRGPRAPGPHPRRSTGPRRQRPGRAAPGRRVCRGPQDRPPDPPVSRSARPPPGGAGREFPPRIQDAPAREPRLARRRRRSRAGRRARRSGS